MKPDRRFYLWMSLRAFFVTSVVLWVNFVEWFKTHLIPGDGGAWSVGWPFTVSHWGGIVPDITPVSHLWRSLDFWIDLMIGLSIILALTYLLRNGCRPWWHWILTVGIEEIREPD